MHPGYQVPFADAIRDHRAGIATGAVGMITEATHAEEILANGRADVVSAGARYAGRSGVAVAGLEDFGRDSPSLPPQYLRAALLGRSAACMIPVGSPHACCFRRRVAGLAAGY